MGIFPLSVGDGDQHRQDLGQVSTDFFWLEESFKNTKSNC